MQTVSGQLKAGEARGATAAIAARQRGSALIYYAVLIGLMAVGWGAGYAVGRALDLTGIFPTLDPILAGVVGMWLGLVTYQRLGRPLLIHEFRRRMTDRGLDVQFSQVFTIADETLTLQSGPVHRTADWRAVTELFKVKGFWIFLVQMEPWFAPTRFFASEIEERAFVREALSHMSEAARARSKGAVAFAASV